MASLARRGPRWCDSEGAVHNLSKAACVCAYIVPSFSVSPQGKACLALISGRTADNPRLLKEVIAAGCTHVYLEKPGAPSVAVTTNVALSCQWPE